MPNRTVYSTVTKGHGDLQAARDHATAVRRMAAAANRKPCSKGCPDTWLCPHGLA